MGRVEILVKKKKQTILDYFVVGVTLVVIIGMVYVALKG